MVLIFRRVVTLFSDFGLTPALVQRPTLTDTDRSTAFWASVGLRTGLPQPVAVHWPAGGLAGRDAVVGHAERPHQVRGWNQEWSVSNYSNGLTPNPVTLYIDDAVISAPSG